MSLFSASQIERGLLGSISNYFGTVETNDYGIIHLHYLVWLKDVLRLAMLQMQFQSNDELSQNLFSFLKCIIKYSAS